MDDAEALRLIAKGILEKDIHDLTGLETEIGMMLIDSGWLAPDNMDDCPCFGPGAKYESSVDEDSSDDYRD